MTLAGKEYLVPNEHFITNQVINWSYSDDLVRVDVVVGVAYESDLERVRELLLEAMATQKRILEDPSPVCLLKEFGSDTVNFELRFWIKDPARGVANIKSDILLEIWRLFRDNGIVIAFPQRDLHIKSITPAVGDVLKKMIKDPPGEKTPEL